MAVTDELDYTPEFTFTTVQFGSEVVNTIVNSLLAVFIIINLGSIISKLVYFSPGKDFSYKAWLRAFIFANSDDPLRIISWISRNYVYRQRKWSRHPNKLRLGRLTVPLLARAFILIVSIVSIGITIPTRKQLNGCSKGDYVLKLDESKAEDTGEMMPSCLDIPVFSERGTASVKASYCTCRVIPLDAVSARILVNHATDDGSIQFIISDGENQLGLRSYVEWKIENVENVFRSTLPNSVDAKVHMIIAIKAIEKRLSPNERCAGSIDSTEEGLVASLEQCNFLGLEGLRELTSTVESHLRNAFVWDHSTEVQPRVKISNQDNPESFQGCVVDVVILRPVVNILPLLCILVMLVLLNVIVSWLVSEHGNALDAGFHLIKETLGHDTTSNPLEENVERGELMLLPVRNWRCGAAGAHTGFIGRTGDIPIDDFSNELLVGGCSRVAIEVEEARRQGTSSLTGSNAYLGALRKGPPNDDSQLSLSSAPSNSMPFPPVPSAPPLTPPNWPSPPP